MTDDSVKRGTAKLRARARIIRTIGSDLISNEAVALVELIKNAYDADASRVVITFEEPLELSKGGICVVDDGVGMPLDVILEAWLEPATISKENRPRTQGGRRVTGEKGIGRFAAARLAQSMEMTSIAKGTKRKTTVRFDWGIFDASEKFLDEITCSWEERPTGRGDRHGTRLHLVGLNDSWAEQQFRNLRGELARLISSRNQKDGFEVVLELPEAFSELAGKVTPPPILSRPHYRLKGEVDSGGRLSAKYYGPEKSKGVSVKKELKVGEEKPHSPRCGPFRFEFRVWDRDPKGLQPLADSLGSTVRDLRGDLDSAYGISIYRDNFRVLLADKDWLELDSRRVQNPTLRLSNNQIVGRVFISADENKGLRDQTNREGIVSSRAFEDFKDALVDALTAIEIPRDTLRRGITQAKQASGLFEELDIGPVAEYIAKRYPEDTELKAFIKKREKAFETGIKEVQTVLARYRRLATLGQLIDVVLHEGMTPVTAISNEVELAREDREKAPSSGTDLERMLVRLNTIDQQAKMLSALFKKLGPFSGRKRGKPQKLTIEKLIGDSFDLFRKDIEKIRVEVELPTSRTFVTVDEAEMQQIFVNLVDNALYWLERTRGKKRRIRVEVAREPDKLVILFSDNGPGVSEEAAERIFDPYFSTKPTGVGLGLTIAGETALEYDGGLELMSGGPLQGATFRITLRKRIGG